MNLRCLCIVLLLGSFAIAQETPRSSTVKVNPVERKVETPEETGSLLFPKKEEAITPFFSRTKARPEVSMRTDTDLLDPGVQFAKPKFKKDLGNSIGFVSDTFLGEIKTGENVLTMVCRDHQYEDGDLVRVWLDDKILVEQIYLRNIFQGFDINLKEGFNKLEIEALNQGSSGPNTAEFKVMDKEGNVISKNVWNLASGVKATMIVIKK
ncbi:hypothetical protein AAU57_10515 [Nonlabens sp. YIK11]|uniref:hypothetical protein n=1 Tax=Nonlabens sp. YIK11 TaxID=1453349 RepID=UPI000707B63A|nr:hypothetical protein [Nonlabens sp. YIK11]KQC33711.1 hypothetical protein AAU57_10515 [Nonlabens sp. YIK11]